MEGFQSLEARVLHPDRSCYGGPPVTRGKTPLETLIAGYWERDPQQLLSLLEERFRLRVEPEQLIHAGDVTTFVMALKDQVDHPGRLERVAERLLRS